MFKKILLSLLATLGQFLLGLLIATIIALTITFSAYKPALFSLLVAIGIFILTTYFNYQRLSGGK